MDEKPIMIIVDDSAAGLRHVAEGVKAGQLVLVTAGTCVGKSMLAKELLEEAIVIESFHQRESYLQARAQAAVDEERQYSRNPFHESGKRKRGKARRKWR